MLAADVAVHYAACTGGHAHDSLVVLSILVDTFMKKCCYFHCSGYMTQHYKTVVIVDAALHVFHCMLLLPLLELKGCRQPLNCCAVICYDYPPVVLPVVHESCSLQHCKL